MKRISLRTNKRGLNRNAMHAHDHVTPWAAVTWACSCPWNWMPKHPGVSICCSPRRGVRTRTQAGKRGEKMSASATHAPSHGSRCRRPGSIRRKYFTAVFSVNDRSPAGRAGSYDDRGRRGVWYLLVRWIIWSGSLRSGLDPKCFWF